jgi:hypothetical protein
VRALLGRDGAGARRLDDRHDLDRYGEDGTPHTEHAHQRTIDVQRPLEFGNRWRTEARGNGQEDTGWIGAVQGDEIAGDLLRGLGQVAGRQVVAPTNSCAPFGGADGRQRR